jgi:hypothetical protein
MGASELGRTAMKYRVLARVTSYVYDIIEAENDEQAWQIAHELDGGSFKEKNSFDGDWEIYSVQDYKEEETK